MPSVVRARILTDQVTVSRSRTKKTVTAPTSWHLAFTAGPSSVCCGAIGRYWHLADIAAVPSNVRYLGVKRTWPDCSAKCSLLTRSGLRVATPSSGKITPRTCLVRTGVVSENQECNRFLVGTESVMHPLKQKNIWLSVSIAALILAAPTIGSAQESLPFPPTPSGSKAARTMQQSTYRQIPFRDGCRPTLLTSSS